jgi:hypothetical protein
VSNVVEFPQQPLSEANIRQMARGNLAAAVAILMKGQPNDDLEQCLHHINEAWGQVAALLILRDNP